MKTKTFLRWFWKQHGNVGLGGRVGGERPFRGRDEGRCWEGGYTGCEFRRAVRGMESGEDIERSDALALWG